jgi:phosphatidylserine/phosphatidylglycerophosphate/cardiolipin synthase-like enzyme
MFAQNTGLKQSRLLFSELCDFYKIRLHPSKPNNEILAEYDIKYSDSEYINTNEKFKLIKAHPTKKQEIQNHVIDMINNAKREVIIIQPYYLPIKKIERAISDALKRGVKVELITSAKRDQPVYAPLKNLRLTGKLVAEGLQVYELHDKFLHMKAYYVDDEIFTLGILKSILYKKFRIKKVKKVYLSL